MIFIIIVHGNTTITISHFPSAVLCLIGFAPKIEPSLHLLVQILYLIILCPYLFLGQTLRFLMQHFGHVAEIMVKPKRSFRRA